VRDGGLLDSAERGIIREIMKGDPSKSLFSGVGFRTQMPCGIRR
jgi:hypothetical protein